MKRTPVGKNNIQSSPPTTRLMNRRNLQSSGAFQQQVLASGATEYPTLNAGLPPVSTYASPGLTSVNMEERRATGAIPRLSNPPPITLSPAAQGIPPYPLQTTPTATPLSSTTQGRIFPVFNQQGEPINGPPPCSFVPSNEDLERLINNMVQQNVRDTFNMFMFNNRCVSNNQQDQRSDFISDQNVFLNSSTNVNNFPNLVNMISHIPFFNDEGSIHPIDFIEQIQMLINNYNIPFANIRILLADKFKGKAKAWGEAFLTSFSTFDNFKNAFVDFFWDETKQQYFKSKIESGIYERGSYVEHFTKYVAMARHIYPPFTDLSLIKLIARHLPPHISTTLIGVSTLGDALGRLKQADYYNCQTHNFNNNHGFKQEKNKYFNPRPNIPNKNQVATLDFCETTNPEENQGNGLSHNH